MHIEIFLYVSSLDFGCIPTHFLSMYQGVQCYVYVLECNLAARNTLVRIKKTPTVVHVHFL